jgi:hydroxypyruvate reductase
MPAGLELLHQQLEAIRVAALRAANAGAAVLRNLRLEPGALIAGYHRLSLRPGARLWIVALGKAAPAMAAAAAECLGDRLAGGVVTTLEASPPIHPRISSILTGHPLPDQGSLAAGEASRALVARAGPDDLLLALISGGGSAMYELLQEGTSLDEVRALNDMLIRSGAPVQEINTVRKALSLVKGGGLARLALPARTVGLVLSDVVGNSLAAVASGPTAGRALKPGEARRILQARGLWDQTSPEIRAALTSSAPASRAEERIPGPLNILIGSNRDMVRAAIDEALRLGLRPIVVTARMQGEARQVGARFGRRLLRAPGRTCLLMGGETTVSVRGRGKGGRNQELALAAALELEGASGIAVLAFASDGVDGPTDAAGAAVDGTTLARARRLGLDPRAALAANDSYSLLHACEALITTGLTGTNVGDLVVGLRS